MIGDSGRATAERSLDDTCTIRRLDPDATWAPGDPLPEATLTVYSGPCSLHAPRELRRSDEGGDQRTRSTHVLALPAAADYSPVSGDVVDVASCAEPVYVTADRLRSHRVLKRILVADTLDAEGAPS